MAPRSLKTFYTILGLVAVAGGVAIVMAARQDGPPVGTFSGPIPVTSDSVTPAAYVLGSDTAPVVIDEYSDFECPFCARLAVLTLPDVHRRLVETGLVRWRFNDFPLDEIHRNARAAHHAAACAADQGQFWPMHDQLYYNQGQWARERNPSRRFRDYAEQSGVSVSEWQSCMESNRHAGRIEAGVQRGRALGVRGTPTLFINGRLYTGSALSFDELRAAVEAAAGR